MNEQERIPIAETMRDWSERLRAALVFLTRVPLPGTATPAHLAGAVPMFPVAGALIGAVAGIAYWFLAGWFPASVAAGVALAVAILLTGALHEDGLADCADAFGATQDRDKALEILRDSRIGAFGAIALVFSILLRWMALASLAPAAGALALIVAHAGGRAAIAIAPALAENVRREGAGSLVAGVDGRSVLATLAVGAVIAAIFAGWAGLGALALGLGSGGLMLAYAQARIGGYTGDVLGAIEQVCEIAVMCILAAAWAA